MCMGSTPNAPVPPPAQPEAAQLPTPARAAQSAATTDRKRKAGSSTVLTSSRGVNESGAIANKTLLGQ